jgi:hypothetical protein
MKRFIAAILATLMTLGLAACADGNVKAEDAKKEMDKKGGSN